MGKWIIQGDDASTIPPDPQDFVPGGKSKTNPPKGWNADDSGGFAWDHDLPASRDNPNNVSKKGDDGYPGAPGRDGDHGGDTPQGYKLFIPPDTDTTLTLVLSGGNGQPAGRGGVGGAGGEGQDGGDGWEFSDDDERAENPPADGGLGGTGGPGGVGGLGGKGGTAYDVDIVLTGNAKWSNIVQQFHQGFGGRGGDGGSGGPGGPGGIRGNNGPRALPGDSGPGGPPGPRGADRHVGRFHLL